MSETENTKEKICMNSAACLGEEEKGSSPWAGEKEDKKAIWGKFD